jgi:DNA-binding transcriptional MerR regulator
VAELLPQEPPFSGGPEIPDKLYFRIGDVASLVGVKQHVLRFWEAQFASLSPKKSGSGQRLYRRKDVEFLLEIKNLLHNQRFTIEGAKRHLAQKAEVRPTKLTRKAARAKSSIGAPAAAKLMAVSGSVNAVVASQAQPMQDSLFGPSLDLALVQEMRLELHSILKMLNKV